MVLLLKFYHFHRKASRSTDVASSFTFLFLEIQKYPGLFYKMELLDVNLGM